MDSVEGGPGSGVPEFELSFLSKPRAIVALICNLAFASMCLSAGPAHYFDWPLVEQGISAAEEVRVSLGLGVAGACALWFAALIIWRLRGPDFDVRVYDFGLVLHPSLCARPISWTEIKRSRVKKTQGRDRGGYWYNKLELELTRPVWSLSLPIPTRKVTISSPRKWGHNPVIAELGRRVRAHRLRAGWKR